MIHLLEYVKWHLIENHSSFSVSVLFILLQICSVCLLTHWKAWKGLNFHHVTGAESILCSPNPPTHTHSTQWDTTACKSRLLNNQVACRSSSLRKCCRHTFFTSGVTSGLQTVAFNGNKECLSHGWSSRHIWRYIKGMTLYTLCGICGHFKKWPIVNV